MNKFNLVNTATVLAGATSGGMLVVASGSSKVLYILLAALAGAVAAIIAIKFDKTA